MTVNEFIREQVETRANAAAVLANSLEINGIRFIEGCTGEGVQVYDIEKLAMILGCEIQIEPYGEKYATYFFVHNNVKFYEHKYGVSYDELIAEQSAEEQGNV